MNSSAPAPAAAPAPDPDNETDSDSRNEIHHAEGKDVAEDLGMDEVAVIFSFLSHDDIMCSRRVCSTWKDVAKKTIVPLTTFLVNSNRSYNAMRVMATALPNLQQITLDCIRIRHRCKYSDGEEPDEGLTQNTAHYTTHDINIISSFAKLRSLRIEANDSLNGRYPVLFNFKYLQQLSIWSSKCLKFDLGMLEGLPSLKELHLENYGNWNNPHQHWTGNLRALRVLKGTLEKVVINYCRRISGNFMDLADFPFLLELHLYHTNVTGDIRDISEHDFPALESLHLPNTVRGGMDYEFQSIAEVPSFMQTTHLLLQRSTQFFGVVNLKWSLSTNSRDWYESGGGSPSPPFDLQFVKVGSRLGWSWCSFIWEWDHAGMRVVCDESCEINWLDPEPSNECSDHDAYIQKQKLRLIQRGVDLYRGYHQPPNELEYRRLCEGSP